MTSSEHQLSAARPVLPAIRKLEFAVMLCLYKNNTADEVREAVRSGVLEQTHRPLEVIVVFDGPVPVQVREVIEELEGRIAVTKIVFPENRGHGEARAAAINACPYPWIGIIDSDDISLPARFELLAGAIAAHPQTAVIGGALREFRHRAGRHELGALRSFPETPQDVRRYIRTRSPFAQPTVMLSVAAIRGAGNYQTWFNNEDYHLWIRLVAMGYELRNIPDVVLFFRINPDLFKRRGGIKYWWNEVRLQWFSLRHGTTTVPSFVIGALARFVVQVGLPSRARQEFYRMFLRHT
jgi:glycosyltransferase involved in cell wall biosynthesis